MSLDSPIDKRELSEVAYEALTDSEHEGHQGQPTHQQAAEACLSSFFTLCTGYAGWVLSDWLQDSLWIDQPAGSGMHI